MLLLQHIKSYLKNSTIHGFRYLVEERNTLEQLIWALILIAAFSLAGTMVSSNLQDVEENPITTSIDTIPVQSLPFPAVTFNAPVLSHPYRLIESAYHNVKFDCLKANINPEVPSGYHFNPLSLPTCEECLEETKNVREDLLPFTSLMLKDKQTYFADSCKRFISNTRDPEAEIGRMKDIFIYIGCYQVQGPLYAQAALLINHCLGSNIPEEGTDAHEDYLSKAYDLMARLFRMPQCFSSNSVLNEWDSNCSIPVYDGMGQCVSAMMNMPDSFACYGQSFLLLLLNWDPTSTFRPGIVLKHGRENYNDLPMPAKGLFDDLTNGKGKQHFPHECLLDKMLESGTTECEKNIDMDLVLDNMDLVYRLYSQFVPPTVVTANEKSELADIAIIKETMMDKYGYNLINDTVFNDYATILICKFDDQEVSPLCPLFSNTFTTSGIGYTFNNEPFWSMYKNTSSNNAFHREMYQHEKDNKEQLPRLIENIGIGASLDFVIMHESYGFNYDRVTQNYYKNYKQVFLALHDPIDVPHLKSEGIIIEPGLAYDIRVYLKITTTDENGLILEPEKRNCQTKSESQDMKIFETYSQTACIFECTLHKAVQNCSCSVWNYPRIDDSVQFCLTNDAKRCFLDIMENDKYDDTCNCMNDCKHVNYEMDVHVTPLRMSYSTNETW